VKRYKIGRLLNTFAQLIFFVIIACFIGGCDSVRDDAYPSDQHLINIYNANKETFTRLQSDPDNRELHSLLGIQQVIKDPAKTTSFWFVVWYHDFPGPGGAMKGFAYLEEPPPPGLLVDSIDDNTVPVSSEEKDLYRRVQGKWYIFFRSRH
jgi:hypothetical protein